MLLFRFFKKLTYFCNSLLNNKKQTKMNLQEFLKKRGIEPNSQAEVAKALMGKKAKVISNRDRAGHNMAIGTIFKIDMAQAGGTDHLGSYYRLKSDFPYNFLLTDIEMLELTIDEMLSSKNSIDEKITELQKEKAIIDSQIAFMKENNINEYDEDLFKVHEVLKKLDDVTLTGIERAKVIASIIKGN